MLQSMGSARVGYEKQQGIKIPQVARYGKKKKCVLRFTLHFAVDNFKILLKLSKGKK